MHVRVLTTFFMATAGQWKIVVYYFNLKKQTETNNSDLTCYVFILEDAVAHLSVNDSSGILNIEK